MTGRFFGDQIVSLMGTWLGNGDRTIGWLLEALGLGTLVGSWLTGATRRICRGPRDIERAIAFQAGGPPR